MNKTSEYQRQTGYAPLQAEQKDTQRGAEVTEKTESNEEGRENEQPLTEEDMQMTLGACSTS